jgi:hypothetical protein
MSTVFAELVWNAGNSMRSTGVRPSSRTTSSFIPGSAFLRHQPAASSTAASM